MWVLIIKNDSRDFSNHPRNGQISSDIVNMRGYKMRFFKQSRKGMLNDLFFFVNKNCITALYFKYQKRKLSKF